MAEQNKTNPKFIAFTGPGCSGKTTLIKSLNFNKFLTGEVKNIDSHTRELKSKGYPINNEGSDDTQIMITYGHYMNIKNGLGCNCIFDRCILDGVVYTQWLKQQDQVKEGTYLTAVNVFNDLISKYDIIFYTSPEDVPLEDDGERSINVKFRDEIIHLFKIYMSNLDNVITLRGTVEERLITIKNTLALLNIDINI